MMFTTVSPFDTMDEAVKQHSFHSATRVERTSAFLQARQVLLHFDLFDVNRQNPTSHIMLNRNGAGTRFLANPSFILSTNVGPHYQETRSLCVDVCVTLLQ